MSLEKNDKDNENCCKFCLGTGEHTCNKNDCKINIKHGSNNQSDGNLSDSIHSGESLLKSFIFQPPTPNSSDMQKCLAFWREILDKDLKPLKCTLINSIKNVSQDKKCNKNQQKSGKKRTIMTKEEKTKSVTNNSIWIKAWKDIEQRKLNQFKDKYCGASNLNKSENIKTEAEIKTLNDWKSKSIPMKNVKQTSKVDIPALMQKIKFSATLEHKKPQDVGNNKTINSNKLCNCKCEIPECCCEILNSKLQESSTKQPLKRSNPCKACLGRCIVTTCTCEERLPDDLKEKNSIENTNINHYLHSIENKSNEKCTCGCFNKVCKCKDVTNESEQLKKAIIEKVRNRRNSKYCGCGCNLPDCCCEDIVVESVSAEVSPADGSLDELCCCSCGLPHEDCICEYMKDLSEANTHRSTKSNILLSKTLQHKMDYGNEKKSICQCGCALDECCCSVLNDLKTGDIQDQKLLTCGCGCNIKNCICSVIDEQIRKYKVGKSKECPCACKIEDCICTEVERKPKTTPTNVHLTPIKNICTCGCNVENCVCSILNDNKVIKLNEGSPPSKNQSKELICLCGCKLPECICSTIPTEDVTEKCLCGCGLRECNCCPSENSIFDQKTSSPIIVSSCPCGCGLAECCCIEVESQKSYCSKCGLTTCICTILEDYTRNLPEPVEHKEVVREQKCSCGCNLNDCCCEIDIKSLNLQIKDVQHNLCTCGCNVVDCICNTLEKNIKKKSSKKKGQADICKCPCEVKNCTCNKLLKRKKKAKTTPTIVESDKKCKCGCRVDSCCCLLFNRYQKKVEPKKISEIIESKKFCECGCETEGCCCEQFKPSQTCECSCGNPDCNCIFFNTDEMETRIFGKPLDFNKLRKIIKESQKCSCSCNSNECVCDNIAEAINIEITTSKTEIQIPAKVENNYCIICGRFNCCPKI